VAGFLLLAFFAVPSSAALPSFTRHALGTLTRPLERTYAVPRGAVLLGVTWRSGSAAVAVRRGLGAWEDVENDAVPGPRAGTEPVWLGSAVSLVTVRVVPDGVVRDAAVDFAGGGTASASSSSAPHTRTLPRLGSVVTRPGWGADERLRSGGVSYTTPTALVVHHTVTSNDYTQAEAASFVRAVYAYHTRSRGWSDIGYNLLVDRFGTVYEGRYGDFAKGVVGAHTAGFNEHTMGVSLLGNYDAVDTPAALLGAVQRVGAWAAERWRIDPRGTVTLTSAGSPRFPRGTRVTVSRMPGHRDLGITACPGRYAYGHLPAIRAGAWRLLRAVIAKPVVTGAPVRSPDPVTVKASIDHAAWWVATIRTSDGDVVARASGRGTRIAVSWDGVLPNGLPALPGSSYTYRLTADDHLHGASDPRSGTFDAGMPRLLP
jgi:uncharacterized protein with LGFP repeats